MLCGINHHCPAYCSCECCYLWSITKDNLRNDLKENWSGHWALKKWVKLVLVIKYHTTDIAILRFTKASALRCRRRKHFPLSLFLVLKLEQLSVDFISDTQRSNPCICFTVPAGTLSNWCKILLVPPYFGDSLSMIPEASSFSCRHLWSTLVFHNVGLAVSAAEVKNLPLSVIFWWEKDLTGHREFSTKHRNITGKGRRRKRAAFILQWAISSFDLNLTPNVGY